VLGENRLYKKRKKGKKEKKKVPVWKVKKDREGVIFRGKKKERNKKGSKPSPQGGPVVFQVEGKETKGEENDLVGEVKLGRGGKKKKGTTSSW